MIVDPMLSTLLAGADLDEVTRALSREAVIRNVMAETGEIREIVTEQVAAMDSMAQEAVLDPWPAEESVVATHDLNRTLRLNVLLDDDLEKVSVSMGARNPHTIFECSNANPFTYREVGEVAKAVHGAVLARVVGDRDHHVQLSSTDRRSLLTWLERPNGSWRPDGERRVTVDAVEGGGILVRTRPYRYQPPADWAGRAVPSGLCPYRGEHEPHEVTIGSLAPFWCTADQSQREPYRSERNRGRA